MFHTTFTWVLEISLWIYLACSLGFYVRGVLDADSLLMRFGIDGSRCLGTHPLLVSDFLFDFFMLITLIVNLLNAFKLSLFLKLSTWRPSQRRQFILIPTNLRLGIINRNYLSNLLLTFKPIYRWFRHPWSLIRLCLLLNLRNLHLRWFNQMISTWMLLKLSSNVLADCSYRFTVLIDVVVSRRLVIWYLLLG